MKKSSIVSEQFDFTRNCYSTGLKKSLITIRNIMANRIFLEEKWINICNCYAFALGLDFPEYEIKHNAYYPGTIGNSEIIFGDSNFFAYEDLIKNMQLDFNILGIDYRQISPLEKMTEEEWRIAIFIKESFIDNYSEDYHFMRQFKNGNWYHKFGEFGNISQYDDNGIIITNPSECHIENYIYKDCLSLRLKN